MLAERVKEWTRTWWEEGHSKGLDKGHSKGLEDGLERGVQKGLAAERRLLLRIIQRRLGPASADTAAPLLASVQSPEIFESIGERVLDSASAEELLDRLGSLSESPEASAR